MQEILTLIRERNDGIAKNPFCSALKDESIPIKERIQFVPYILEVVMGFRNFLELVSVENPETEIDKIINHHCEEDEGHWRWYLRDIQRLDIDVEMSFSDFGRFISNSNSQNIRKFYYLAMKHSLSHSNRIMTLICLEVLEAGFATFITSVHESLRELNLFSQLEYFGRKHYEAEMAHDAGNWVDDSAENFIRNYAISDAERAHGKVIVNTMFDAMTSMFDHWHAIITKQNIASNELFSRN